MTDINKIIEELDRLTIQEGKTYDAIKIGEMGAKVLDMLPDITSAIRELQKHAEVGKRLAVIMKHISDENIDPFVKGDIEEAIEAYNQATKDV